MVDSVCKDGNCRIGQDICVYLSFSVSVMRNRIRLILFFIWHMSGDGLDGNKRGECSPLTGRGNVPKIPSRIHELPSILSYGSYIVWRAMFHWESCNKFLILRRIESKKYCFLVKGMGISVIFTIVILPRSKIKLLLSCEKLFYLSTVSYFIIWSLFV